MKNILNLATIVTLALTCQGINAQTYPARTITLVNAYTVGGPADQVARTVAKSLSEELGQQVIVESKPGAGGSIAAGHVARAQADGYTLLLANNATQVMAPATTPAGYDGVKDFQFLGMAANVSNVLVVHPSVKATNIRELVALAKASPGTLNYASSGIGGGAHIAAELFKHQAGINLTHVPYTGAAQAFTDLMSGQVQVGIFNISGVLQFIKSGRMRPLAYASSSRSRLLPDLPTFAESGLPNYAASSWYAIAAPRNLPPAVSERLVKAISTMQSKADFNAQISAQGAEVWALNSAQTLAFVQRDSRDTLDLIKAANLQLK